jgi:hypothetical protein
MSGKNNEQNGHATVAAVDAVELVFFEAPNT